MANNQHKTSASAVLQEQQMAVVICEDFLNFLPKPLQWPSWISGSAESYNKLWQDNSRLVHCSNMTLHLMQSNVCLMCALLGDVWGESLQLRNRTQNHCAQKMHHSSLAMGKQVGLDEVSSLWVSVFPGSWKWCVAALQQRLSSTQDLEHGAVFCHLPVA